MSKKRLLSAWIAAGLAMFFSTEAFGVQYKAGDLRDPFSDLAPPPMEEKPAEVEAEAEQSADLISSLDLQGIVIGGKEPSAIINGKIVKIGTRLNVGEISNITKDGVYVRYAGKDTLLKRAEKKDKSK